jgi:hypothetical protein
MSFFHDDLKTAVDHHAFAIKRLSAVFSSYAWVSHDFFPRTVPLAQLSIAIESSRTPPFRSLLASRTGEIK